MGLKDDTIKPEQWVKTYGNYLYSMAFIKLSNKQVAEDIVQETFLSALKARDSFRNESSEKTWLTAILKNKIIDYYRKKDVLKDVESYISDTESDYHKHFFSQENGHWLKDSAPVEWKDLPDKKINRKEFDQIVQRCIQKMPTKLIPVFIAKFLNEGDSKTICKEFGITASNYWVIIHRAKVLVRSCLEKNWFLN